MSFKKNSSNKSNCTPPTPKKSYHFFSLPTNSIMEGEIIKVFETSKKKYYFTLFEEDFLYFEVLFIISAKNDYFPQDKTKKIFKGAIHFDFDLKIHWILKSTREKSQKLIRNKILGFQFVAGEYYEEFESNDEVLLNELKEIFRKKMNQVNFHDYYRAMKKLGKGNFASVMRFF